MKNNRIIISIGIIAVLVLYLLLANKNRRNGDIPNLPALKGSLDEIVISANNKQIKFAGKDGKWIINGEFPADNARLEAVEKSIKDIEITDLISKGQYYQKYDLNPEKAIKVVAKISGEVKRDILIGKAGSTSRNTYIKLSGSNNVYLASGNLAEVFSKDIDNFMDKQIHKFSRSDIESLELNYQGRIYFEQKKEAAKDDKKDKKNEPKAETVKWISKDLSGAVLDEAKAGYLADAFAALKADSYPAKNKKDLTSYICLVAGKVQGRNIEFRIHKKDGENYLCSSSESPYIFTINEWTAKKFFKKKSDFKTENLQKK